MSPKKEPNGSISSEIDELKRTLKKEKLNAIRLDYSLKRASEEIDEVIQKKTKKKKNQDKKFENILVKLDEQLSKMEDTGDEEQFECEICFAAYESKGKHVPLVFDCGHTMCKKCTQRLDRHWFDRSITCPFCNHKFLREISANKALLELIKLA